MNLHDSLHDSLHESLQPGLQMSPTAAQPAPVRLPMTLQRRSGVSNGATAANVVSSRPRASVEGLLALLLGKNERVRRQSSPRVIISLSVQNPDGKQSLSINV